MTRYKVGTPHRRKGKKVKTNCVFCGKGFTVSFNMAENFVCGSCKEHFREEMKECQTGVKVMCGSEESKKT